MVYYRKYRPQKIAELDLILVREKFTKLLKSKDLPHAFLFTGPKGLGKTSSARILAKAINCGSRATSQQKKPGAKSQQPESDSIEPCNTCEICVSITNGSHVDVIEIDAASNRGIDEIRELRERVKFSPAELSKKVYIIDEVHMLTTEAFNALLKTLEEPPDHVLFILCTTEEWKIPVTVISRTFHVTFEKPTEEEIVRSLQRIVSGENLKIHDDILKEIFLLSDGAFRNAAKSLEELAFFAKDQEITTQTLETVFKTKSSQQSVEKLISSIAERDIKSSMKIIQEIADLGVDFKIVHEKLVHILHDQLLIKNHLSQGSEIIELGISEIKDLLSLINTSYGQLRFSVLAQLPLEIALLEYFVKDSQYSSDQPEYVPAKVTVSQQDVEAITAEPVTQSVQTAPPKRGRPDMWGRLIDAVKQENHSVAGILRGCKLAEVKDGVMVIESKFTFHGERLMEGPTKKLLEKFATQVVGKETTVEIKITNEN